MHLGHIVWTGVWSLVAIMLLHYMYNQFLDLFIRPTLPSTTSMAHLREEKYQRVIEELRAKKGAANSTTNHHQESSSMEQSTNYNARTLNNHQFLPTKDLEALQHSLYEFVSEWSG
jgi:hypothetical protein